MALQGSELIEMLEVRLTHAVMIIQNLLETSALSCDDQEPEDLLSIKAAHDWLDESDLDDDE